MVHMVQHSRFATYPSPCPGEGRRHSGGCDPGGARDSRRPEASSGGGATADARSFCWKMSFALRRNVSCSSENWKNEVLSLVVSAFYHSMVTYIERWMIDVIMSRTSCPGTLLARPTPPHPTTLHPTTPHLNMKNVDFTSKNM